MPGISDLIDSDMEESQHYIDENSLLSSASESAEQKKLAPAKKVRKRKCVTMPPKSKARVTKSSPAPAVKKTTKKATVAKQNAIENQIEQNDFTEVQAAEDEQNEVQETGGKAKPRAKPASKAKTAKKVASGLRADEDGMEVEQTPMVARSSHAASKPKDPALKVIKVAKAPAKRKPASDLIEETQPEQMALESQEDDPEVIAPRQGKPVRDRTESRSRQEQPYRRRAGSASDTERGDPNLRRRLGDITRKFENMDTKFRQLKEVGISEASLNVEKLRKQCEATTEASNKLVTSLRRELAVVAPKAQDAHRLQSELDIRDAEIALLRSTNNDFASSLTAASNEIKALQAKLAAARKASVEPASSTSNKTPKATTASRPIMTNGNVNQESAQHAQMKLDLYSDLTGLIIRSVKRNEEGDTYDCIQTGRNGTLHFKLFIDAEDAKTASFEETEFLYTPQLDANRDREMIELMPPYLAEDITFARQNAAKFYQRVVDTLTRRTETPED